MAVSYVVDPGFTARMNHHALPGASPGVSYLMDTYLPRYVMGIEVVVNSTMYFGPLVLALSDRALCKWFLFDWKSFQ